MHKQMQLFKTDKYNYNKKSLYYCCPQLMKEWDYKKNNKLGINPKEIYKSSHEHVWWKCNKCGYEWKTMILSRTSRKSKCPVCTGIKVLSGYNDLATLYPELLKEWDYERNNKLGLDPSKIKPGTSKKAWWRCPNGHEYFSVISNRRKGVGCAICKNKKVLKGYNDLASNKPEILKLWNYEKNEELGIHPDEFTTISGKKVWWKCERGHEWFATIAHVVYGRRCPECNKGNSTSFPEQAFYYYIKKIDNSCINRYRVNDKYELDIFIEDKNVGIEYDGYHWHGTLDKQYNDFIKSEAFYKEGIILYRIKEQNSRKSQLEKGDYIELYDEHSLNNEYYLNSDDEEALNQVIGKVINKIFGINIEIDVKRDRAEIYKTYLLLEKKNSVLKNKSIIKYWDYEKNEGINPAMISRSSGKIVWWKCDKGHSYQASVHSVDQGNYCPICREEMAKKGGLIPLDDNYIKTLKFSEDIKSLLLDAPEIAAEWDYEKNYPVRPENIVSRSNKKFWWKCKKCGYEWQTTPLVRTKGVGCKKCGYKSAAEKKNRKIVQYSKDGRIIREYNSIEEAKIETGVKHISCVCRGERKTAGGFIWKYKEEK